MVEMVELRWEGDETGGGAWWEWNKMTKGKRVASGERKTEETKIEKKRNINIWLRKLSVR